MTGHLGDRLYAMCMMGHLGDRLFLMYMMAVRGKWEDKYAIL
jgi:hypothetical protein